MKRNLALILSLAMLVCSLFSVISFAEGTDATAPEVAVESYEDVAIAYADVSYSDKIYMKFAVPAYTDLPEGATLELIVWGTYDSAYSFSYADTSPDAMGIANAIAPQEQKATIGGVEHFVFAYDAISVEMMTDVVYARPVITLADGTRVYGDVINYSIVEYVTSAKGGFEGIEGLTNQDHLALLDTMLEFGAMAQSYSNDGDGYLPCGFFADDELNKIWVTPVYDGVVGEKIFGGFYKAGSDYATVFPPVSDLYSVIGLVDAEGVAIEDDSLELSGIQMAAPESGDLEITMNLSRKAVFDSTIENGALGYYYQKNGLSTFDQSKANQRVEMPTMNLAGNSGYGPNQTSGAKNCYAGYKVLADPFSDVEGEKALLWTGTNNGAFYFQGQNSPVYIRKNVVGIGDTIDPVLTVEFTIAGGELGIGNTANFRIRSDYAKSAGGTGQCNLNIFKVSGGKVMLATSDVNYVELCTLSSTAFTTFAITIDFRAETIAGYVADENGVMQEVVAPTVRTRPAAMKTAVNEGNVGYDSLYNWLMTAQSKIEWYGGGGTALANLESTFVDMDGDGTAESPLAVDGVINKDAYIKYFELHQSLLIKNVTMYVGEHK